MTETEFIATLKDSYLKADSFRKSLDAEMSQKATQGELWNYVQCADWEKYEQSLAAMEMIMKKYFS